MSGAFIRNLWYVAAWSHELTAEAPIGRVIIDEPVALYRKRDGSVVALEDRCPHRHAPLSLGRIEGDDLRCMYHGLRFGSDGVCKEMPGRAAPPRIAARTFPVAERWSWIWVWMGDPAKADAALIPEAFGMDDARFTMRASALDYEASHELIHDNLCDLSHLDFSHATTLGGSSGVKWATQAPKITQREDGLLIERWFLDAPLSPGRAERGDTLNRYRYVLPGLFLMTTEWFPVGTAEKCGFETPKDEPLMRRVEQQAVTPIGEKRSRYLYATGVEAGHASPAFVEAIFGVVNAAFAEDKLIIEGQQRIWDLTPPERRKASIPYDEAPILFRRLMARRIADEQGEPS